MKKYNKICCRSHNPIINSSCSPFHNFQYVGNFFVFSDIVSHSFQKLGHFCFRSSQRTVNNIFQFSQFFSFCSHIRNFPFPQFSPQFPTQTKKSPTRVKVDQKKFMGQNQFPRIIQYCADEKMFIKLFFFRFQRNFPCAILEIAGDVHVHLFSLYCSTNICNIQMEWQMQRIGKFWTYKIGYQHCIRGN